MKRLLPIVMLLLLSLGVYGQEKIGYELNGQPIEFTISPNEVYVEHLPKNQAIIQSAGEAVEEVAENAVILKTTARTSTFQQQRQQLSSTYAGEVTRVEPVLTLGHSRYVVTGSLNIRLKSGERLEDVLAGVEFTFKDGFTDDLYFVSTDLSTEAIFSLVNQLQVDPRIDFVEPDLGLLIEEASTNPEMASELSAGAPQMPPNDYFYEDQWAINNQGYLGGKVDADMDVDEAWELATGEGIKVAIVDTGVDLYHPDLQGNLLPGHTTFDDTAGGEPINNHGTACAGIVAALINNEDGVVGIAPNSKIIPVKISNSRIVFASEISKGIAWAWENGADVISNSYGGTTLVQSEKLAIDDAIAKGRNGKGCVMLFASGNDNAEVSYPAAYEKVIAVGATSMCDERKSPSSCDGEDWGANYGANLDIVAPGVKIYTTYISGKNGPEGGYYLTNFNGTSAACPNAAGVAALILSVNPALTHQEVRKILESTTDKIEGYTYTQNPDQPNGTWNEEVGYGRVNARKAVELAIDGKPVIDDRHILIDLYNATDGPNWNTTWDLNADISTWYGVKLNEEGRVIQVNLQNNNLKGFIPESIGGLSEVTVLLLSLNDFVDGIPESIGELSKLTNLNLNNCGLTGEIPASIGNLPAIYNISLFRNKLTGDIPVNFSKLSTLEQLDLRENNLTGGLENITGLIALRTLNMSSNNIAGEIPENIGDLQNLTKIYLDHNNLHGEIPQSIASLKRLTSLSLDGNNLTGEIPASLGDLTSLQVLYLENNKLSGEIPASLEKLPELRVLYLANNDLSGKIPEGLVTEPWDQRAFRVDGNKFVFEDIEGVAASIVTRGGTIRYERQDNIGDISEISKRQGETLTLQVTATSSPNNSYQWRKNKVNIPGATQPTYTIGKLAASDAGSYDCVINNSKLPELQLYKNPITVTVSGSLLQAQGSLLESQGELTLSAENLKFYPNPVSDVLNISGLEGIANVSVWIVDEFGNVVFTKTYAQVISTLSVPMTGLRNGLYVVKIRTSTQGLDAKIYKQ